MKTFVEQLRVQAMNKIIALITILVLGSLSSIAQDCLKKFDDANRAYFNGNVREIEEILRPCLDNNLFEKDVEIEALRLLINSYIILQEPKLVEISMKQLLLLDPEYKIRSNDLIEFKAKYEEFKIVPRYNVGLVVGVTIPSYTILRYHSYASETQEPSAYESYAGLQLGINTDIQLYKTLYLNTGLVYSFYGLRQEEIILNYQLVSSRETNRQLSLPLQLRYIHEKWQVKPFIGAGVNLNYLISSRSEINHVPIAPEVASPFIGVPQTDRDYNLTGLKKRFLYSWLFSAGVQYKINRSTVELRVSYDYGVANMIDESKRYSDEVLLDKFAYVPDDYKTDFLNISFSYFLTFSKPVKK